MPRGLVNAVAVIITVIWAFTILADVYVKDYEAPQAVQNAMMLVATALFASNIVKAKNGNGK